MTCVFFGFLKVLEGHPELALPTIQSKVIPAVVANYVIWPAAHIISFRCDRSLHHHDALRMQKLSANG